MANPQFPPNVEPILSVLLVLRGGNWWGDYKVRLETANGKTSWTDLGGGVYLCLVLVQPFPPTPTLRPEVENQMHKEKAFEFSIFVRDNQELDLR